MSCQSLNWSPWRPLSACWTDRELTSPGLYRIRRADRDEVDYIGQTGLQLRDRLRMLQGVYRPEMPYRDPPPLLPPCGRSRSSEARSTRSLPAQSRARRAGGRLWNASRSRSTAGASALPDLQLREDARRLPDVVSEQREGRRGGQTILGRPPRTPAIHLTAFDLSGRVARPGRLRRHTWCDHWWSRWMAM